MDFGNRMRRGGKKYVHYIFRGRENNAPFEQYNFGDFKYRSEKKMFSVIS